MQNFKVMKVDISPIYLTHITEFDVIDSWYFLYENNKPIYWPIGVHSSTKVRNKNRPEQVLHPIASDLYTDALNIKSSSRLHLC